MSFWEILQYLVPATMFFAAPLIFTALGGIFSERSGVVNIGLEGLMAVGAFSGVVFNLMYAEKIGSSIMWVSLLFSMVVTALTALLHAIATVSFRADQTVSGVAINLLAAGGTIFLVKYLYEGKGQTDYIDIQNAFVKVDIPYLSEIPIIGPLFFKSEHLTSYVAIIATFIVWYIIYKTPFGLRLRAVGEHPMAADTMGINVARMRYIGVLLSGALAGIGGAVYSQSITLSFTHSTISGQGFMALAAMIFGKWNPIGAMGAAIFFGFAQSLSIVSKDITLFKGVPDVYLLIAPYLLTILALAGFIGRADAPKALGTPYIKGKR